ncbi:MAG: LytR/AlgR family response regulator transcription factor [Bacteroidales bacterium]
MLKAIIVDDEEAALRALELLVQAYCPNVSIVAKGESVNEGLALIKKYNPDIVFLDIEMPHGNGFELIERSPNLNYEVIFITAYNQFAIKAFKYSAIDYILKPIDPDELVSAVQKVSEQREKQVSPRERYAILFDNIKEILPRKLVLPTNKGISYVDLDNVIYTVIGDNDIEFYFTDKSLKKSESKIQNIKEILLEKSFIYAGSNCFINLNKVVKVERTGKGTVIFDGGHKIELDSTNKDELIATLTHFSSKEVE